MSLRVSKFLLVFAFVLFGFVCANAQFTDASSPDGRTSISKEDLPDGIKETFAKQRIKAEEKDFNEMLERCEEAAKISGELYKSFEANQKLSPDDAKKMERLEKLVKKIRDELGSESDDEDKNSRSNNSSLSFTDALKTIQDESSGLSSELKKQGRFSISVTAVESSNTLLKLVRFVRQNQN